MSRPEHREVFAALGRFASESLIRRVIRPVGIIGAPR
jgi:hypothetical protein